ncbi:MAG: HD domain-containing protein [Planctomycetes bacterium]|nr:HD domain-containing protein [Planctomycetota bacterium]
MPELEPIIEIARAVLVGRSPLGREDTFLFDHSLRVMRVAERLSACREVRQWRLDRFALSVAALFHQAATVRLEEERRTSTVYAAAMMSDEDVKEYSAELAGDRLAGRLPPRQLEHVQEIIRHTRDAASDIAEAKIVSDADSLDDIGTLGIWRDLRRNILEGRGVEEAVRGWQRREQYGYWEARMREALRLETSRRLAAGRLAAARAFMEQLAHEGDASDMPPEDLA